MLKRVKRFLAIFCALVLVANLMPHYAMAQDTQSIAEENENLIFTEDFEDVVAPGTLQTDISAEKSICSTETGSTVRTPKANGAQLDNTWVIYIGSGEAVFQPYVDGGYESDRCVKIWMDDKTGNLSLRYNGPKALREALQVGEQYKISAYYKGTNDLNAKVEVKLNGTTTKSTALVSESQWTKIEHIITIDSAVTELIFFFGMNSAGTNKELYIDNITVEKLVQEEPEESNNLIADGSFEGFVPDTLTPDKITNNLSKCDTSTTPATRTYNYNEATPTTGWQGYINSGEVVLQPVLGDAADGNVSMKLTPASTGGRMNLRYDVKALYNELVEGASYKVTAYFKTEGTPEGFSPKIEVHNGTKDKHQSFTVGDTWTKVEHTFILEKNTSGKNDLYFFFGMSNTGTSGAMYIDNISLELVALPSITLNETQKELEKDATLQLTSTLAPAADTTKIPDAVVQYKSSNENVAKVDANGLVTAVGPGKATITAYAYHETVTAVCEVNVPCEHVNEIKDHECDVCGAPMGGDHVAAEGSHICDYCGKPASECADEGKDHKCDVCGETVGEHADGDDNNHTCDYCQGEVEGEDHNYKNGVCTECGEEDPDYGVAQIGNKKYGTLAEAVENAASNDTIVLMSDIDYGTAAIIAMQAITIDLNGHTLTAGGLGFFCDGGSIVDNGETKGLLALPAADCLVMTNAAASSMLPVWNEEGTGYLFVAVNHQYQYEELDEDSFRIIFSPDVFGDTDTNKAYFGDGAADNGLSLYVNVYCMKDNEEKQVVTFRMTDELISSIYTHDSAIQLTINGASTSYDSYKIEIVLIPNRGASSSCVIADTFTPGAAN